MLNKQNRSIVLLLLITFMFVCALFYWLFKYDNKYQNGQPYGNKGTIVIKDNDLHKPIYLIDDWEFYGGEYYLSNELIGIQPTYLFIGQYSNFSQIDNHLSVFDKGTYRMIIDNQSQHKILTLQIPEIFTDFRIYIDGKLQELNKTHQQLSFLATGKTELLIQVENNFHYYSGIYYPLALGTSTTIASILNSQTLMYCILVIFSLSIFLISLSLWYQNKDEIFKTYGLLCLFFAMHSLYPFIHQQIVNYPQVWYCFEDVTYILLLANVFKLCQLLVNKQVPYIKYSTYSVILICVIGPLWILPMFPQAITLYGAVIDIYKILISISIILLVIYHILYKRHKNYIMIGTFIFSFGQILNVVQNNLYEPIYTIWQNEYTTFIMVLIFFVLIIKRNKDIVLENKELTLYLEKQVDKRTEQLRKLLEERKKLFSNVLHDLKAPIASMSGYIQLLQQNDVYIDSEINEYIASMQRKNQELQKRMERISEVVKIDNITYEYKQYAIEEIITKVYQENKPEVDVAGITFTLQLEKNLGQLYCQIEKILIAFENLIYNAITFTDYGGEICIKAYRQENTITIEVIDNGQGISIEEPSYIFDRYYSSRNSTGIGLDIVKTIIEQYGGTIRVQSKENIGTKFYITFIVK